VLAPGAARLYHFDPYLQAQDNRSSMLHHKWCMQADHRFWEQWLHRRAVQWQSTLHHPNDLRPGEGGVRVTRACNVHPVLREFGVHVQRAPRLHAVAVRLNALLTAHARGARCALALVSDNLLPQDGLRESKLTGGLELFAQPLLGVTLGVSYSKGTEMGRDASKCCDAL